MQLQDGLIQLFHVININLDLINIHCLKKITKEILLLSLGTCLPYYRFNTLKRAIGHFIKCKEPSTPHHHHQEHRQMVMPSIPCPPQPTLHTPSPLPPPPQNNNNNPYQIQSKMKCLKLHVSIQNIQHPKTASNPKRILFFYRQSTSF